MVTAFVTFTSVKKLGMLVEERGEMMETWQRGRGACGWGVAVDDHMGRRGDRSVCELVFEEFILARE